MRVKHIFLFLPLILGCSYPKITHLQSEVLIEGIDINQSIKIAGAELGKGKFNSILGLWSLRDQRINSEQAQKISNLYFNNIDKIEKEFAVWHLTWAISNFYRNGDEEVKGKLSEAFIDAKVRAKNLNKEIADEKVNGNKVYMGFSHFLGYGYAKKHLVVPGNKKFLQSYDEYKN